MERGRRPIFESSSALTNHPRRSGVAALRGRSEVVVGGTQVGEGVTGREALSGKANATNNIPYFVAELKRFAHFFWNALQFWGRRCRVGARQNGEKLSCKIALASICLASTPPSAGRVVRQGVDVLYSALNRTTTRARRALQPCGRYIPHDQSTACP
jgi:hypothetical protein